ncbi:LysR family transcriptional regulator [Sphingomonas aracearum]|uniref:LysR family transcriptional regulator n=1 Tax=Sphingomonas aracearum TaxID=2283317 RepID=A0A369W0K9_9SPHN|nr:LysR family transcriptional regulator [Sphingomonas aracearum]RDE05621.1 LysR family transcriptional regulator [Sphingomonas aracearum]
MQPMRWDELQDFLAIARTGQIARAAEQLGVDATTIGRRLRRLEARLGQVLFEQTRQGQALTEDGERLLRHVEGMQQMADRIAASARATGGLAGVLKVSVSEGFGSWFIARHLHDFVERHPGLTVELAANNGFLNPSRRETDVAIMLARPQAGPVVSGKLTDYRLSLYAAPAYLARCGVPADAAALATGHRLIGYVPDLLYAPELNYLDDLLPGLTANVRSSSINAQHRMIASGLGIGVLPRFIGDFDAELTPVLPALAFSRSFWIVTHRDTRQLQRVRAFRAWILETVARRRGDLTGREAPPPP